MPHKHTNNQGATTWQLVANRWLPVAAAGYRSLQLATGRCRWLPLATDGYRYSWLLLATAGYCCWSDAIPWQPDVSRPYQQ